MEKAKYQLYSSEDMNEKNGTGIPLTIVLVAIIVVLVVAFAFSYSSMHSEINAMNQKISNLNGKISTQNTTILDMKSNGTNMSRIIAFLQGELDIAGGNYTKLNLLFSWVNQIYGIHANFLGYNATATVPAKQYQEIVQEITPSNNTTIVFLTQAPNQGSKSGNGTSTLENITYLMDATGPQLGGVNAMWGPILLPNFSLWFYNTGNVSATFNFTIIEIWSS